MPVKLSNAEYERRIELVKNEMAKGVNELVACKRTGVGVSQYRYALARLKGTKGYKPTPKSERANHIAFTMRTTAGNKKAASNTQSTVTRATEPTAETLIAALRNTADRLERLTEVVKSL
jgi:hypothetical protein